MGDLLPRKPNVSFDLVNRLLTKKDISHMIDVVYRHCGQKETVIFCDRIMGLGFSYACRAGISFGKDDMVIPETKDAIVHKTSDLVREYEQQYNDGLITRGEKYNKVVDTWTECTEQVAKEMMKRISAVERDPKTGREKPINSIYMMSHSGARGSPAQMKQLAGMRGLMTKPSGEIIETPIISNFKEGLSVLEYFNSTHGARKGLADTALKTANSGYLTRRLVDVAQDCIVTEEDCGTTAGITARALIESGEVTVSLGARVLGRTAAENVKNPATGKVVVKAGELMEEEQVEAIEEARVQEIRIRSALTCETRNGICAKCYGRDLARGTPVNHRRGRGRHRRAVDRRAWHPAHHAHLPFGRCGERQGRRSVVLGVELRRHGEDQAAQRGQGLAKAASWSWAATPSWSWPIRTAPSVPCTGCLTARICALTTAPRSSAAIVSPSGTPIPARCSPRSKALSTSRIWSKACRSASGRTS